MAPGVDREAVEDVVAIVVTLAGDDRTLHGTVGRPGDVPESFSGWLDLLRILEAVVHSAADLRGD